ncbi:MAG: hypothetical protein ACI971_002402, partial [Colwellia sp.]
LLNAKPVSVVHIFALVKWCWIWLDKVTSSAILLSQKLKFINLHRQLINVPLKKLAAVMLKTPPHNMCLKILGVKSLKI